VTARLAPAGTSATPAVRSLRQCRTAALLTGGGSWSTLFLHKPYESAQAAGEGHPQDRASGPGGFMRLNFRCAVALVAPIGLFALIGLLSPALAAAAGAQRYVVILKDGTSASQTASTLGVTPTMTYSSGFSGFAGSLTSTQQQQAQSDPNVVMAVPDQQLHLAGTSDPVHVAGLTATDAGAVTPINSFPQFVPPNLERIGVPYDPTARIDGKNQPFPVGVAVLDTGIEAANPELNVVGGVNCSDSTAPGSGDVNGHGTEVSGVLAAEDNSYGIVGVAPGAPLYSVRALNENGGGETSNVVCGIDWVIAHSREIRVANMSFTQPGTSDNACGLKNHDPLHYAICRLVAHGVTPVVAAGNDSVNVSTETPAAYPEVITATGLADTDGKPGGKGGPCADGNFFGDDVFAPFSNYGAGADIAAVATCDYTTYPDNSLVVDNGTSFAAPAVAGAAALLLAREPWLTPAAVKLLIQATAERDGSLKGDPRVPNEGVLNVRGY
jgi:subtilisin